MPGGPQRPGGPADPISRRRFGTLALGALGAAATPWRVRGAPHQPSLVDGDRLNRRMNELVGFSAAAEGTTRLAYSDEDRAARDWLSDIMSGLGLDVHVDRAANLIGRRPGTDPSLSPILVGSHIDSVPAGGSYDGQVGSMGALEALATLADAGRATLHPLELVIWANEEGGKTGSRAIAGEVRPEELDIVTASGFMIGEGTRRLGGDLTDPGAALREPESLTAYLELHIEQGFVLDRGGLDIGVVEGIVGIRRWTATVDGFANHAGTTPMDLRQDAMVTAARIIDAVHMIALELPGRHVATVGRLTAEPGAPNVIPGRVTFSLEIRDLSMDGIDAVFRTIRGRAEEIAAADGTTVSLEQFYESRAAPTDPRLRDRIEAEARDLGLTTLRMPSGAGHDAQSVALLGPVGMIFVPSHDGISHSPLEFTAPDQITAGANVLLRTLLAIDEQGL
ncbi:Zn-dependent hydrolase [Candidatus Palauibacter sp.]|uniref:Zn-dependent hydrolase n=1 Tax=Candidatus Palauibacter sp. TaxID=3101350 RepID=UPI003B51BB15